MSHLDKKIFGKKSYSDLLKEIYDNQKKKEDQMKDKHDKSMKDL